MNVLIADGNPTFRSTLKQVLRSRPNIENVWEAKDGEEAVRLAREGLVDLVLMDLAMPRIDGLEATRLIKDCHPGVQVIVFSAHDEAIYQRAARTNGAEAFLAESECVSGLEKAEISKGVDPIWIDQDEIE